MKLRSVWRVVLAVGLACATLTAGAATLYKWIDKDGKVTYQDQPPPPGAGRVEEREIKDVGSDQSETIAEIAKKHPVVIYTIPKCSSCDLVRDYLQKRLIPFTEKNVALGNLANQKEMQDKVGDVIVPTILVGAKVMKGGYIESLLEGELDAAGYPNPKRPAPPAADTAAQTQQ